MINNTQKSGAKYSLSTMPVDIEDASHLSNYFVVSELPSVLNAGKTLFAINGSPLLKSNAQILVEVLDASGNALYYEVAESGYYSYNVTTDLAISITVDQSTEPGIGTITLVGTTATGQNVRWSTNIKIDPSQENRSKVIFYQTPKIETNSSLVYVLNETLSSANTDPIIISGSIYGTPNVPRAYSDINAIDPKKTQTGYTLTTLNTSQGFSSDNVNSTIVLNVDTISYLNGNNIVTRSVDITQSYDITGVINTGSITIDSPFTYFTGNVNQVVPIIHGNFTNKYVHVGYITGSEADDESNPDKKKIFQYMPHNGGIVFLKNGYLEVTYSNLATFTGKVYRHKIYRRSLNKSSDYECIADEPLENKNILIDTITVNRFFNEIGKYPNQTHVNRYYYSSSANLHLTQSSDPILDSMTINCSSPNPLGISLSQYIIIKNNSSIYTTSSAYIPYDSNAFETRKSASYDSNFLELYPNTNYSIGADLALTSNDITKESRLTFYFTGSFNNDLAQSDPAYVNGVGLKLAEYILPPGKSSVTFDSVMDKTLFSFVNDYRGTIVMVPVNLSSIRISNFSVSTFSEYGFNPDLYTVRIPFDVTVKNEQFEIKIEFFDVDFNLIYSELIDVINFDQYGQTLYKYIPNYLSADQQSVVNTLNSGSISLTVPITASAFLTTNPGVGFFGTASYALNSSGSSGTSLITGSTYPITSSWSNNSVTSSNAISSSYALSASYAANVPTSVPTSSYSYTSSWSVNSLTASSINFVPNLANTASYNISSSHSLNSDNSVSSSYSISSSWAPTPPALVTGSTYPITSSWSNYSISSGYSLNSGTSTNLSGGYVSSSGIVSNTISANTASFSGLTINDYLQLLPVNANIIPTDHSAGYIYVSGSTNQIYFSQYNGLATDTVQLSWLEDNLYTGVLWGGSITTGSSTTINIGSGSGIIVNLNATITEQPYPTINYVNWNTITNYPLSYLTSSISSFIGIDSSGNVLERNQPWADGQHNTDLFLGLVLHQNFSTINGVVTYPALSYGYKQRTYDFIKAFGSLKLSGYAMTPSGSSTGSLTVGSGTAWADGRNYTVDPNNPSYIVDPGTNVSKIFRYYQSGSSFVYDSNGGIGYSSIDPTRYNSNGVLTAVPGTGANRRWTVQRCYWFPNSATKAVIVYYGNATYTTQTDAIANIPYETFSESTITAESAISLGTLIVRNNATFTDSTSYAILSAGLFRNSGGSGGSSTIANYLTDLTDVSIVSPTSGDLLIYGADGDFKWNNSKVLNGSYSLNGSLDIASGTSVGVPPTASARLYSNTVNGVNQLNWTDYTGYNIRIGRDVLFTGHNSEINTLNTGEIVYISGSTGTSPNVKRAMANSLNTLPAVGIVINTGGISSGGYGRVLKIGRTECIFDTSRFNIGDKLYVSATNSGSLTNVQPSSPNYTQFIGYVITTDATSGSVSVNFNSTEPLSCSYALSSSYSNNSTSASYSLNATTAQTASSINFVPATSSYSNNSTSASYSNISTSSSVATSALTASSINFVPNLANTASYNISSSHSLNSDNAISSSYALSSSWAPTPPSLVTGSTYPITSSWSNNSVSSSYANTAGTASYVSGSVVITGSISNAVSASYSLSSSYTATASYIQPAILASFGMTINGNGAVPSTGIKGFVTIPYNLTVTGWYINANTSGSAVVDVIRSTYGGASASVAGSELPTLSSQISNRNLTVSTWTSSLNANDIIQFNLNSVSNSTIISVSIIGNKR